jgi:DNA mismatch repair protein MutS
MPQPVVERAKTLLVELEKHQSAHPGPQLALFGSARSAPAPADKTDPLRQAMAALDPDAMSPRDALEALYRLKDLG